MRPETAGVAAVAADVQEEVVSAAQTREKSWNIKKQGRHYTPTFQTCLWYYLTTFIDVLGTYGLTLLGNPCANAWGLRGGGCGHRAGRVDWEAFATEDWITPFRLPSIPFTFSWGLPATDAMSPLTVGREELPDRVTAPRPSLKPRLRPLGWGWMKEAGLCCGGGVLWKEREELLWDGLPERSSWNKKK